MDDSIREREITPLNKIPDYNERVMLTVDSVMMDNIDGMQCTNIVIFLRGR